MMNRPCNYDEIEAFLNIFDTAHPNAPKRAIEGVWDTWLANQATDRIEGHG